MAPLPRSTIVNVVRTLYGCLPALGADKGQLVSSSFLALDQVHECLLGIAFPLGRARTRQDSLCQAEDDSYAHSHKGSQINE